MEQLQKNIQIVKCSVIVIKNEQNYGERVYGDTQHTLSVKTVHKTNIVIH